MQIVEVVISRGGKWLDTVGITGFYRGFRPNGAPVHRILSADSERVVYESHGSRHEVLVPDGAIVEVIRGLR